MSPPRAGGPKPSDTALSTDKTRDTQTQRSHVQIDGGRGPGPPGAPRPWERQGGPSPGASGANEALGPMMSHRCPPGRGEGNSVVFSASSTSERAAAPATEITGSSVSCEAPARVPSACRSAAPRSTRPAGSQPPQTLHSGSSRPAPAPQEAHTASCGDGRAIRLSRCARAADLPADLQPRGFRDPLSRRLRPRAGSAELPCAGQGLAAVLRPSGRETGGGGQQGVTRQHRNRRYLEVPPVRVEQPRERGLGVGHAGHEQLPDAETNTDSRSGGARAGLGCEAQGPCTRLARAADGDLAHPGPWRNRGLRFEASAAPPLRGPQHPPPPRWGTEHRSTQDGPTTQECLSPVAGACAELRLPRLVG